MTSLERPPEAASAAEPPTAQAGAALADGVTLATDDEIITALKTVFDPEIPVDIYELGLIYDLRLDGKGGAEIDMTLTAPACPVAGELPKQVADVVAGVPGVGPVSVWLKWDPPWTPERMSEDAKMALNF